VPRPAERPIKADKAFTGDDLRCSDPKFQPPRLQQYVRAVAARGWAELDGSALGLLAAVDADLSEA
jgi:hypothetical protein